MTIGFIGLGKMGSRMVCRLLDANHNVVVYDKNPDAVVKSVQYGAIAASSLEELVSMVETNIIWVMIPEKFVTSTIEQLSSLLPAGSIVVDGGNSDYRNTLNHEQILIAKEIQLIDAGMSGGVHGLKDGYSIMVGGSKNSIDKLKPIFSALAAKDGFGHFGATGTGHYVKMIHNGVEYGLMQSYAEGYRLLKEGHFKDIDLAKVANVWQHGSINKSFLNQLIAEMLTKDSQLNNVEGFVNESGEARWTIETAKQYDIELPVIKKAFQVRIDSQSGKVNYATKFLALLRNQFGGHSVNKRND